MSSEVEIEIMTGYEKHEKKRRRIRATELILEMYSSNIYKYLKWLYNNLKYKNYYILNFRLGPKV